MSSRYPPPPGTTQAQYSTVSSAYHPVQQVRQTFGLPLQPFPYSPMMQQHQPQIPPPAPIVETTAPKKKIEWPDGVRSYVQRSFLPENLIKDISRADMETQLRITIGEATDSDTLLSLDWDNQPLPQHMIRTERASQALAWQQKSVDMHLEGNGYSTHQTPSKKRKSQELGGGNDETTTTTPPWRTTNNQNAFEDRITYQPKERLDKRQQPIQDDGTSKGTSKFQKIMEKRQRKFDGGYKSNYRSASPEAPPGPVIGTNQTLEKQYLRLTSAPNPSQVRPEYILRQTLELLKTKWRKESNYGYICDQFKSMRQDLTVQHIKNDLTVSVYEIHARIALEKGDLGEYNQCQTQLRVLYAQNLGGHPVEFKAYRILYFIHTCNRTALNDVLADLTVAEKKTRDIKHALDVRSALALGNYHRFFRLYLDTPNMGAYLMDMFVVRERLAALSNICKAYRTYVKLRFITEELGFESDGETVNFIVDYKGQHILEERDGELHVNAKTAGSIFEAAKADAFRKVDIKGQI